MEIVAKAQKWLDSQKVDQETKSAIEKMINDTDQTELTECFYKDLEFGTGGLRGIMGIGSNRMNKYTVGMATQGLANYLNQTFAGEEISVAIAHDSRNNSRFFAETTAAIFSANNIKVYLFEDLRPTPELSYAIRKLGCKSGVVLTASHNPKEYNGYKAYWNDGAQLVPPHDKNVITEVGNITSIDEVKFDANQSLISSIGKEIDEPYLDMIKGLSLSPEAIAKEKDLKIVFSAIHGTGTTLVRPVLEKFGFTNVTEVEEQSSPDGNFPTVVYPNPEEAEALSLALKKAEEIDADLVMATDPDSDRVGIAVKNDKGDFQLLNGNQTGSLLLYYLIRKWQENGKLDGKQYVVKTIVTTDLIEKIAAKYDVKLYNTLTGFKYIAEVIRELEGSEQFIGGGEESYGYLIGDDVRDKDAIASCAMIAEMAAWAKASNTTLYELLQQIHQEFGLYQESLKSLTKKGKSGAEEINEMMVRFRETPPNSLGGSKVVQLIDYKAGTATDLTTNTSKPIDYPASNVLQFFTEDGSKVSVRPSGTEPKIKFYFSVNAQFDNINEYDSAIKQLKEKTNNIIKDLGI
ncbi:phospho-sugar mutase [Marinoscillum furvescens]|uniref:Phosphoglucomutase n=1 Tax=Marinoscillum furvescens DSM 4134 TaxID=1122208 RepID=A0A3D9L0E0_MARFU|nr:phospho-sugar mutase [Marinoscillum furvescens]RED95623.1 phosphoglucomutase [Marinoscillum furvescens DSM 4134]